MITSKIKVGDFLNNITRGGKFMSTAVIPPAGSPAASEPIERIKCQWCQGMNLKTALSCQFCGASLSLKDLVSESGWREAPRLKDMTEIHFSHSTCQVEGE